MAVFVSRADPSTASQYLTSGPVEDLVNVYFVGLADCEGDRPGGRYRKLFIELMDVRGNIALGDAVRQLCGDRPRARSP